MAPSTQILESLRVSNATRIAEQQLVAVFTGGTSGIGEFTLHSFATHAAAGKGARIYIVGRNQAAADKIAAAHSKSANLQFRFVKAHDLSLIANVDACCSELCQLEGEESDPRIDLLLMTHADLHFGPRRETKEGLDKTFSLLYYSRIRIIQRFMPLLEASVLPSARAISIFGAGLETPKKNLYLDDLALRQPNHCNNSSVRNHVVHMQTVAFEKLAEENSKVSFIHIFPGVVITPGFDNNPLPWWLTVTLKIAMPAIKLFAVSADEIGERVLGFASQRYGRSKDEAGDGAKSTKGVVFGGAYAAKYDGLLYTGDSHYDRLRADGFDTKVWEHTQEAFKEIEAGRCFEG